MTPAAAYDGGNPVVWAVCARALSLGLRVLGTVRISGAEHVPRSGAALLAANHVSHLDPVVLLVVAHRCGRKVRIMGVKEVHDRPLVGRFVRAGRHIPVVQGTPSRAPLLAAERALAAGELVLVYPEGTIPEEGAEVAAKGGVGLLTGRAGVPVVPLRSRGLERGALAGWRPWRRLSATVTVGAPVDLPDVTHLRGSARYAALGGAVLDAVRRL
jgi:1-acyl-sn-glycerol-3-phosphate acyltransferase